MGDDTRLADEERSAHDAFVRWQEASRKQLGGTVKLVLTLATAAIAFVADLLTKKDNALTPYGRRYALLSLVVLSAAALFGVAVNITRLWDFRWTARAARVRDLEEQERGGVITRPMHWPVWLERNLSNPPWYRPEWLDRLLPEGWRTPYVTAMKAREAACVKAKGAEKTMREAENKRHKAKEQREILVTLLPLGTQQEGEQIEAAEREKAWSEALDQATTDETVRLLFNARRASSDKAQKWGAWTWLLLPCQLIIFFAGIVALGFGMRLPKNLSPDLDSCREVGRFVETGPGEDILLDTATGQWCWAESKPSSGDDLKACRDLP